MSQPTPAAVDDMFQRVYFEISDVLDEALGTEDAGAGLTADVRLLAQRYADLKAAVLGVRPPTDSAHWKRTVELIEASPLRCAHGLPADEECLHCLAEVEAALAAEVKP